MRTEYNTRADNTVPLEDLLAFNTPVRIRPVGLSMHPFIRRDDFITITPYSPHDQKKIETGDCIFFRDEGDRWLIHRVIKYDPEGVKIITKGDALLRPDRPIAPELVRGRVTLIERAASRKTYCLDRRLARKASRLIALLSRIESALPSPRRKEIQPSSVAELIGRIIKAPKWLLTRICFP